MWSSTVIHNTLGGGGRGRTWCGGIAVSREAVAFSNNTSGHGGDAEELTTAAIVCADARVDWGSGSVIAQRSLLLAREGAGGSTLACLRAPPRPKAHAGGRLHGRRRRSACGCSRRGGDASGGGGGGGGFGITGALVVVLSGLAFVVHWMGLWGLSKHCEEYVPIAA